MKNFICKWRWRFLNWVNDHTGLCWTNLVTLGNDGIIKGLWEYHTNYGGIIDNLKGCGVVDGKACYCGKYQPKT